MKNLPRWTRLITEEFYLQGDEEKKRGLKVKLADKAQKCSTKNSKAPYNKGPYFC